MLFLIGLGGAGSKIVGRFYKKDVLDSLISRISSKTREEVRGVAIDTSSDLARLTSIPLENRVLIGKSRAKGHGTGGDVALGEKIFTEELELAMGVLGDAEFKKADRIFLIAGLGGGTGTGGFRVLAEKIKKAYRVPIIGVLTLPSKSEGVLYSKNAYDNFASIKASVDGTILLDNNVLTSRGEAVKKAYRTVNDATYGFLSAFDADLLLELVRDRIATVGIMQAKAEMAALKDILNQVLKNHVYLPLSSRFDSLYVIIYGDKGKIYGEGFAEEWVKNKYGAKLECTLRKPLSAKYFSVNALIIGVSGLDERLAVEAQKKEVSSELESLLKDIRSLD